MSDFPKILLMVFIAATLALTGACSKSHSRMKIKSDYDPLANFSKLTTYKFVPSQTIQAEDKRVYKKFVDLRIRRAVEDQMINKNFLKVSSGKPDFWITYHAVLGSREKISKHLSLDIRDLGDAQEFTEHVQNIDEGSLFLAIVDPKTTKPIWWGSAQADINLDVGWDEKEKRINKAVQKILKEFPPK